MHHPVLPTASGDSGRSAQGRLLKLNFPVFSGEDPQLWKFRCENYFEMYEVEQSMWIKVASMHLEGVATRWFQSVELRVRSVTWEKLCALVHDRFGRDQHEALIRQLFHIRQSGSVAEYIEQFLVLIDQLAAYESDANPLYYAMRFVDGLKEDIRKVVMIQGPGDLDSACALTMIQEEAYKTSRRKDYRRADSYSYRSTYKLAVLPIGPPRHDKPLHQLVGDDKKVLDQQRSETTDDKLKALRQYRRARGLCDKCAEKWVFGHKCAPTVQLHVVQELWELLYEEDSVAATPELSDCSDDSAQLCVCISQAAVEGVESPKSMRVMGSVQGETIMMLIDSGSAHTFISSTEAAKLAGVSTLARAMHVKVANGNNVVCSVQLKGAEWELQGCTFTYDFKVIPLVHFDVILGYDWLEAFSPMKVHWGEWGILSSLSTGSVVQVCCLSEEDLKLDIDDSPVVSSDWPVEIHQLLSSFADNFATKVQYPPQGLVIILFH
jgi:hypothetical protein